MSPDRRMRVMRKRELEVDLEQFSLERGDDRQ